MKRYRAILCTMLSLVMLIGAVQTGYAGSSLSDITSDSIQEKEEQIDQMQEEKKVLQTGLSDVQKMVNELEAVKGDMQTYVTKLDANLAVIEAKIAEVKDLIHIKEEEIKVTTEVLGEAQVAEAEQYEAMKQRIRFMYERGSTFSVELLLSADSFGDMLNKADYIAKLSEYDRRMLEEYEETRKEIEECRAALEEEQTMLEEAKAVVEQEQASLNTLIYEKTTQIDAFEADINNKEQIIAAYEAEIKEQNETIAALEAAVAEERKRIAQENGKLQTYDGGQFQWPAPSFTRISEEYGDRIHPILKTPQFHNGIDIAAPNGSPILAAYDGEVVAATYSATMGNYIMIDHGDSLYTIYMHASALYVNKGDLVIKGEKIAAIGSTGRSTGPHLHFSVRLNGSYVSPWNYIG